MGIGGDSIAPLRRENKRLGQKHDELQDRGVAESNGSGVQLARDHARRVCRPRFFHPVIYFFSLCLDIYIYFFSRSFFGPTRNFLFFLYNPCICIVHGGSPSTSVEAIYSLRENG